ncbi:TPA: GNAT family N-acetyltransferase [bacterium]|nr:GNAT family N-acetyltransferase [bacterium]
MIEGPMGAKPEELDELCELVGKVFNWQMRENFPTLFCNDNTDNLRIIKEDGKIVSHFGFVIRDMIINGCRISVGNVGAVCTDENYRKKGYAWKILDQAIEKYRADGVDMFLVSGSRSLYIQHGCTHVGKVKNYAIYRGMPIPSAKVKAIKYTVDDLPVWSALYRNEPIRFHRPYNDFLVLTTSGLVYRPDSRLFSISDGNKIVAYVVGSCDNNKKSFGLHEYAGSRKAIIASIPQWFEELNVDRCVVPVNLYDIEFNQIFHSLGIEPDYGTTGGTIVIINFPQMCERLLPLFEEKIGSHIANVLTFSERDGNYVIGLDGDEAIISDPHDLARIIFGDPPILEAPTKIPAEGKLLDVIKAIFPIPRPEYGLSYI